MSGNGFRRQAGWVALAILCATVGVGTSEPGTPRPKLVDLGAKACVPCKRMAPILEDLRKTCAGAFDTEFIDVWLPENQVHAKAYAVKSIPTQIFLSAEGKELWRHEGFLAKDDILAKWAELGVTVAQPTPAPGTPAPP